jgi:phospholipid/cholesterol/gamma-HCH transport system ATP-binding protein
MDPQAGEPVTNELPQNATDDGAKASRPLLELAHVTVRFGRQLVLRQVDLTIQRGHTLAIIGESGCGKTVLLKTIIGLVRPAEGHVAFDGQRLSRLNDRELTRLRTRFGFVFQQAALFDSMTIAQNVEFPLLEHHRMSRNDARARISDLLSDVGLPAAILEKKPAELSGGMRKRVGLARALVMEPEVLLYDEPTTGLDPIVSDVINELIIRTRQKHAVTSILVTHDMRSALKVADRIVMLYPLGRLDDDEPQIIFDGTPDDILACDDSRVSQFVRGEAGERLTEMGVEVGES